MKKHRYVKRDQPCVDAARLSRSLSRDVYVCSRFPAFNAECLINAINAAAFRAGKSTDEKGLARHTQALQNPPTKEKVLATETRSTDLQRKQTTEIQKMEKDPEGTVALVDN